MLLWFNHPRGAMYQIGTYDRSKQEQKFVAEYHGQMQYGSVKLGSLHAPSAFSDSAETASPSSMSAKTARIKAGKE